MWGKIGELKGGWGQTPRSRENQEEDLSEHGSRTQGKRRFQPCKVMRGEGSIRKEWGV